MSGFTWALIPKEQRDVARAKSLVDFLWWCTHDGQTMVADLGFAPLPPDLTRRIEAQLRTVSVGGSLVLGAR